MSRLEEIFEKLSRKKEGAFMPHVYVGDPSYEFSLRLIEKLKEAGADILELGVPFSDPIADGPAFIAACERALRAGMTPQKFLQALKEIRSSGIKSPIVVTAYANTIFANRGFIEKLADLGVDGLIVPDMPFEESGELLAKTNEFEIDLILQIAPTTSDERLIKILENASGFVYVINFEGVTGPREDIPESTIELVKKVRKHSEIPLVAGFGISKPEHARKLIAGGADGVAVGSIFAEIYSENEENQALQKVFELAKSIKEACVKGYKERITK
ncbi:MAG: tryptophan synthase subunit alpha [Candidatus Hadarchaeales archaeon]